MSLDGPKTQMLVFTRSSRVGVAYLLCGACLPVYGWSIVRDPSYIWGLVMVIPLWGLSKLRLNPTLQALLFGALVGVMVNIDRNTLPWLDTNATVALGLIGVAALAVLYLYDWLNSIYKLEIMESELVLYSPAKKLFVSGLEINKVELFEYEVLGRSQTKVMLHTKSSAKPYTLAFGASQLALFEALDKFSSAQRRL